jgi:hypothetical protein
MKKVSLNMCLLFAVAFTLCRVEALTLYVSPKGNDTWSGESSRIKKGSDKGPLASLVGARDRLRVLRKEGCLTEPVDVIFADGIYEISESVVFEPQDSGTPEAPITFKAAGWGAEPVICGGRKLPSFEEGPNGMWQLSLPWAKEETKRFEQLYINGKRAQRAKSPNKFYYYMQEPVFDGIDPLTGKITNLRKRAFVASKEDIAPLSGLNSNEISDVVVKVFHSWEASLARMQCIDFKKNRIYTTASSPWDYFRWKPNLPRYQLENFIEALDQPGEWFLDREGILFYMPLEGEKISRFDTIVPVANRFIEMRGDALKGNWISNLTFDGLRFEYAGYQLPAQGQGDGQAARNQGAVIEMNGVRDIVFTDCEMAHTGLHGIWFRKGCRLGTVQHCYIHDIGGGAIRIGDIAWSKDELPDKITSGFIVDNNILHAGGRVFSGATGVWIGHAGNVDVTHNDIADFTYTGISIGWTWGYKETVTHNNTLAFNHIHHIGWGVLSDMGGIYCLGDLSGSVVTNNHIHDVYSYDYTGRGGWGLYTDEGSAKLIFENNLIHHTKTGSIHQHYGKENTFRNNILASSMNGQIQRSRIEEHTTVIVTNNIIYWDNDSAAFWRGHVGAAGTTEDVVFDSNTYWNPNGVATNAFNCGSWAQWRESGHDLNSKIEDPLFRNVSKGDYRLKSDSPAIKCGFVPFDYRCAGVYGKRSWRKLARKQSYRDVEFAPVPRKFFVTEFDNDFEEMVTGKEIPWFKTHTEKKGDSIIVSSDQACSGKKSLKFKDVDGLKYKFNPHIDLKINYTNGIAATAFALKANRKTTFFFEWRDYPENTSSYISGPSVRIKDGAIYAVGRDGKGRRKSFKVCDLPSDDWVRLTISAGLGAQSSGKWRFQVMVSDKVIANDEYLFQRKEFNRMKWFGICADGDFKDSFYIDDLKINLD